MQKRIYYYLLRKNIYKKIIYQFLMPLLADYFLLVCLAATGKIPPPDMITVLLLPPSYHFPEFSGRKWPVRFHLGSKEKEKFSYTYL
jgi:hypothetical protein